MRTSTTTSTRRFATTAVGTVIGAALLVGGLSGCNASGSVSPSISPAGGATPSVVVDAPVTGGPTLGDVPGGPAVSSGAGQNGPASSGGSGTQPAGGGQPGSSNPGGGTQPGSEDPGTTPPADPPGDPKPIDPGTGSGHDPVKPKPVVRDHRDPKNPGTGSSAPGGVTVTPSNPYGGATVRDHRDH